MNTNKTVATILTKYMQNKELGDFSLAQHCNLTINNEKFIHRSTIRNWRTGIGSKRITNWEQLIVLAYVLEIDAQDLQSLLKISRLPDAETIFEDGEPAYEELEFYQGLMTDWVKTLRAQKLIEIEQKLENIPTKNYDTFIGHEQDIATLVTELCNRERNCLINIYGLSGSGKTALAKELAYKLIQKEDFQQVIWLDLANRNDANQIKSKINTNAHIILAIIANKLKLPVPDRLDTFQLQHLQKIQAILDTIPYLIVIDNVTVDLHIDSTLTHLYKLAKFSKILLLSQVRLSQSNLIFNHELPQLSQYEAAILFKNHANQLNAKRDVNTQKQFDKIYNLVGGHPYALILIARLMQDYTITPLIIKFEQIENESVTQLYNQIYVFVWQRLTPQSKQLLKALSLVSQSGADESYLLKFSGLTQADILPQIKQLRDFAILHTRQNGLDLFYYIHQLTESFVSRQVKNEDNSYTREIMLSHLCFYWLSQSKKLSLQDFESQYYNITRALNLGIQTSTTWEKAAEAIAILASLAENSIYWQVWMELLKKALDRDPQKQPATRRQILSRLGWFQRLDADLDQAIQSHQAAFTLAKEMRDKKAQGQDHFNLCVDYRYARQYELAHMHGIKALRMFNELELGSPYLAPTLNVLGLNAHLQTKFENAQEYFRQAIVHYALLKNLSGLSRAHNNLGTVLKDDGDQIAALEVLKKALYYAQQSNGVLDKEIVSLSLCNLYLELEQLEEAQKLCATSTFKYEKSTSPKYHCALMAECHGRLYHQQNSLVLAIKHFQAAMILWQDLKDIIHLATIHTFIAETYWKMQNIERAVNQAHLARNLFDQTSDDPWGRFIFAKFESPLNIIIQYGKAGG